MHRKRSTEEKTLSHPKRVQWSCRSKGSKHIDSVILARGFMQKVKDFRFLKCREELLSNWINNCSKPIYAREFSKDIKIITLAIQRTNVEAYKFLCELSLPSNSQISRTLPITCGISPAVLQSISMQLPKIDEIDKLCALVLDDISLMKRIEYNSSSDCLEGFVDIHGIRHPYCADSALVLMACGLMSGWRQPLCLYFTHLMDEESIMTAIEDCVTSLLSVGLYLVAVVSNIRERTISAIKTLATRSFPQGDGHCIKFGSNKVFHFVDPWCIQEQMRDSCLKYNIKFKGKNGEINITKIDSLMEYLEKLKTDKSLGLISTLVSKLVGQESENNQINAVRNEEYFADMFKNPNFMRIIELFRRWCLNSQNIEGLHLVEFINMISNVFDTFNTDLKKEDGVYRSMITSKSIHHELLSNMLIVDRFEFLPRSPNDEPNNKCFHILKSNIVSLQSLWQMLHKQGLDNLQTVHLNLGPLLNFFNAFKQKAKNRKLSLSCKALIDSFKLFVIESNLVDMSEADWVNCEDFNYFDDDDDDDDDVSQKYGENVKLFEKFMKYRSDNGSKLEFKKGVNVRSSSSLVHNHPKCELLLCSEWCEDFTNNVDQRKVLARATNLCSSFLHTFYLSKLIYSCFSCFQTAIQCQCSNSQANKICRKCKNPNLSLAKQMYQIYLKTLQNLRTIGYMSHLASTLKLQFSCDLKRSLKCTTHRDVLSDNVLEFVVKEAIQYFSKRVNSSLLSLTNV